MHKLSEMDDCLSTIIINDPKPNSLRWPDYGIEFYKRKIK